MAICVTVTHDNSFYVISIIHVTQKYCRHFMLFSTNDQSADTTA